MTTEKKNIKSDFAILLTQLREAAGLDMVQLAAQLGCTDGAVWNWENDKANPSDDHMKKLQEILKPNPIATARFIAAALERRKTLSHEQIKVYSTIKSRKEPFGVWANQEHFEATQVRESSVEEYISPSHNVSLLGWLEAGKFSSGTYSEEGKVITTLKGKNLFALRVKNHSMSPEFGDGEIIIVDTDARAESGHFVVVQQKTHEAEATLKQLKIYDQTVVLHPLNSEYEDMAVSKKEFEKQYKIVGKVVAKQKEY